MMDFVAIDVETANASMSSLCQIGIAEYQEYGLVGQWSTYIDPLDFFDGMNISIYGIDQSTVIGAPVFEEVYSELIDRLEGRIVVCHTHFDRAAINQTTDEYELPRIECQWLDSARITRRAWPQFAKRGYGLGGITKYLGYQFNHHDALEDAKAAGHVVLSACREKNLSVEGWLVCAGQPIFGSSSSNVTKAGNPEGPLFGEMVVFTGVLSMPRREAADIAAMVGCNVGGNVTTETTVLVVGDQDVTKLAGHNKSSKHRKAETLISKGVPIRILRETDFLNMMNN